MEVPGQEAGQRAGQDRAQQRRPRARSGCAVREMMPRVRAAMSETPVDSPSRPSMKLMLLIMPTIQSVVSRTGTAGCPGVEPEDVLKSQVGSTNVAQELERVGDAREQDAAGEGDARPAANCPSSCQRARSCQRSSMKPRTTATDDAARTGRPAPGRATRPRADASASRHAAMATRPATPTTTNVVADRQAAQPRRPACRCTRRAVVGHVDGAHAPRDADGDGRQQEAEDAPRRRARRR